MRIEPVTTFSRFVELREDWNRLAGDLPMRSWEWAYSWAETMLAPGHLMILVGFDEATESVIGIAPLYRKTDWLRGDVIHFLGDESCCTDYTSLLTSSSHANDFVDAVATWLANCSVGYRLDDLESLTDEDDCWLGWDLIHLEGVDSQDPVMRRLMDRMADSGSTCHARSTYGTWRTKLPTEWEDYVCSLSKSQRRNVRMVERRVLNADGFTTHIASDQESLAYAMRWLQDLHQKRWTSVGEPGCFADENFTNFLTAASMRLLERDALRVLWIAKEGQPVAVDLTLLGKSASYGYQMGIDPSLRNQEIGRALMVAAMRTTLEGGRETFDFLRGDEIYKTRWMAIGNPLIEIEIVPNRSLPQLRQNLTNFGRTVKSKISRR
ncbi:MAG: GNAT family N-acetyltransferase [Rubripirellula sp.]